MNRTSADVERNASATFVNISAGARSYEDNSDIVLFVIDTRAVVMAHSSCPGMVGSDETDRADVSGKRFVEALVRGALKNGTGQEDYIQSDPNCTGLYYKIVY